MIQLPPQPKPEDFILNDCMYHHEFTQAMQAWERVCLAIVRRRNSRGKQTMSILVLSGLPGSGKTTYALEWLAEAPELITRERTNYDDLRVELFGCKGTPYFQRKDFRKIEQEMKIEALRRAREALLDGFDVVIDNTNLTTGARAPWEALAKEVGCDYEQHDVDTPIAECVRRDSNVRATTG